MTALKIDAHSATWLAVKSHANTTIEAARKRLETAGLGLTETEHERGTIRAMRDLLKLAEPSETTRRFADPDIY